MFANLLEAKDLVEEYRQHYNHERPHSALDYRTPAVFAASCCELERVDEELRKELESVSALSIGVGTENGVRPPFPVKRYARKARQRDSLAPKKGSGRPPKLDENAAGRLLEEDIKERPAATVEQRRRFLEHLTGETLSNSTVRRLLKRLGFSRKRGLWGRWSETSS